MRSCFRPTPLSLSPTADLALRSPWKQFARGGPTAAPGSAAGWTSRYSGRCLLRTIRDMANPDWDKGLSQPDFARVEQLMQSYGLELLGPPLS